MQCSKCRELLVSLQNKEVSQKSQIRIEPYKKKRWFYCLFLPFLSKTVTFLGRMNEMFHSLFFTNITLAAVLPSFPQLSCTLRVKICLVYHKKATVTLSSCHLIYIFSKISWVPGNFRACLQKYLESLLFLFYAKPVYLSSYSNLLC